MTPDLLFSFCNLAVLPFWGLLVVAPRWSLTQPLVHSVAVPSALAVLYLGALLNAGGAPEGAGFGSLRGVMLLFSQPWAVLAGWIHYLAFDLFVGAWEARDAQRHELPHLAVVPCLLATLMVGPIGLALYALLRRFLRGTTSLVETPA